MFDLEQMGAACCSSGGPVSAVLKRSGDVSVPVYEDRDLIVELEQGWLLTFQLHERLGDETAICADGTTEASSDFDIGLSDGDGLLVEISDGNVDLNAVLCDGFREPSQSLDLQVHCSVMDEKMKAFAQRFIS